MRALAARGSAPLRAEGMACQAEGRMRDVRDLAAFRIIDSVPPPWGLQAISKCDAASRGILCRMALRISPPPCKVRGCMWLNVGLTTDSGRLDELIHNPLLNRTNMANI